jgi:hypothetical protein
MTNNYVSGAKQSAKMSTLKPEEVSELFIQVGWIGRRRKPGPLMRLVPFFDKGPGVGR